MTPENIEVALVLQVDVQGMLRDVQHELNMQDLTPEEFAAMVPEEEFKQKVLEDLARLTTDAYLKTLSLKIV